MDYYTAVLPALNTHGRLRQYFYLLKDRKLVEKPGYYGFKG